MLTHEIAMLLSGNDVQNALCNRVLGEFSEEALLRCWTLWRYNLRLRKIRILIIEDCIPFQRMIRYILEENRHLQVVGVASDGEEGVREAEELAPDLILLDIGLPQLNGFEVARKILAKAPQCRIVMVTQESSLEYVRESFAIGACGYVLKNRLTSDLLPAVKAVMRGERFASSGMRLDCSPDYSVPLAEVSIPPTKACAYPRAAVPLVGSHNLQVYSSEKILLKGATSFVANAIRAGQCAVVVACEALRRQLLNKLRLLGMDMDAAVQGGQFIGLDVEEIVSLFMLNGMPDAIRFTEFMGGLIAAASHAALGSNPRVAVFAECTAELWGTGKEDAALRVERLWNHLASRHGVNILCAYAVDNFHGEEDCQQIINLCQEHSSVLSG